MNEGMNEWAEGMRECLNAESKGINEGRKEGMKE